VRDAGAFPYYANQSCLESARDLCAFCGDSPQSLVSSEGGSLASHQILHASRVRFPDRNRIQRIFIPLHHAGSFSAPLFSSFSNSSSSSQTNSSLRNRL